MQTGLGVAVTCYSLKKTHPCSPATHPCPSHPPPKKWRERVGTEPFIPCWKLQSDGNGKAVQCQGWPDLLQAQFCPFSQIPDQNMEWFKKPTNPDFAFLECGYEISHSRMSPSLEIPVWRNRIHRRFCWIKPHPVPREESLQPGAHQRQFKVAKYPLQGTGEPTKLKLGSATKGQLIHPFISAADPTFQLPGPKPYCGITSGLSGLFGVYLPGADLSDSSCPLSS